MHSHPVLPASKKRQSGKLSTKSSAQILQGVERAKVVDALYNSLSTKLNERWAEGAKGFLDTVKRQTIAQSYNVSAGVAGGASSSITQDVWDGKSFKQVMTDAVAAGGIAGLSAAGLGAGLHLGGSVWSKVSAKGEEALKHLPKPEAPIAPEAIRTQPVANTVEAHPIAAPAEEAKESAPPSVDWTCAVRVEDVPAVVAGAAVTTVEKTVPEKVADKVLAAATPPVPDVKTITTTGNTIPSSDVGAQVVQPNASQTQIGTPIPNKGEQILQQPVALGQPIDVTSPRGTGAKDEIPAEWSHTKLPNGDLEVKPPGGGTLILSGDGALNAVSTAHGESISLSKIGDQQVVTSATINGETFKSTGDGVWRDAKGKVSDSLQGPISVNEKSGAFDALIAGEHNTFSHDGSRFVIQPNGATREYAPSGDIIKTSSATGRTAEYGYDSNGVLNRVEMKGPGRSCTR